MNSMKRILGTIKNMLLLAAWGTAETLLILVLVLLYPLEVITEILLHLCRGTHKRHQEMLEKLNLT